MKISNNKNYNLKYIFLIALLIMSFSNINAITKGYCVEAEVSDISPSSIGIGEEFTVGVQIENCGDDVPEVVFFEIINPSSDITIKEPLKIEVPKLVYSNSERYFVYHMKTANNAKTGTYVIKAKLSYGDEFFLEKYYDIQVNIIGDEAELSIASAKTQPTLPYEGETVELTLRIENTGDGTAKSVEVYVDHPFQGLKQSFIGALDSDEDGPVILTFIVDDYGEFEFPVIISYKDDFGEKEINTSIILVILKKKGVFGKIIIGLIILLIILWAIYYYFKIKKSKDTIIQQLLTGVHETSKKSLKRIKR